MQAINRLNVNLLDRAEQELRFASMTVAMKETGIQAALIRDNANIFYLTGRVFRGYVYIDTRLEEMHYFVRRPNHLSGTASLHYIRKPEEITAELSKAGLPAPAEVALELDAIPFSEAVRLARAFGMERPASNISPVIRACRAVKTEYEQNLLRDSGRRQTLVYKRIPQLYSEGMTDIELQIEIERALRLEGCLGQFRISGGEMELFMGNVLTGEN
ncbi:MAG: aminopeptidase P family N-terminal domain-containing protein, partial [Muribaculaceae bacterium]|nr:aminopeptidase P family N-terminal domain-containing protein [Muribaculaceae bacterium]